MIDLEQFIHSQRTCWSLLDANYSSLEKALVKSFSFDGFEVFVQFNPGRIASTSTKTDEQSIQERPCFLCYPNRPSEQEHIDYRGKYEILVNPYPILDPHFTIAEKRHIRQEMNKSRLEDLLDLAKDLPGYTLLYNGPKCGASIPNHFHFQAIRQNILPIEKDIEHVSPGADYLRSYLFYKGLEKEEIIEQFDEENQMINLVCWYKNNSWQLVVFPRKQHRPRQYFETGDKQILISPGVIDFGGILITPRKEDFDKMNNELIKDIYTQLTL